MFFLQFLPLQLSTQLHITHLHHLSAVCSLNALPLFSLMHCFFHLFLAILSMLILFPFEFNCAVRGLNHSEPLRDLEVLDGHIKFVTVWRTSCCIKMVEVYNETCSSQFTSICFLHQLHSAVLCNHFVTKHHSTLNLSFTVLLLRD